MKALVQRTAWARVRVEGVIKGEIEKGLLVLLGVEKSDIDADMKYIADKLVKLRIFTDENDKMNLSVRDVGGGILLISQFTLLADCRKGTRPSFDKAERPERANELYEQMIAYLREQGINMQSGVFGADMKVELLNDGPVTVMIERHAGA